MVICGPGGQSLRSVLVAATISSRATTEIRLCVFCRYPQSSAVELVSEVDGLRIISSRSCSFVQKVPCESHHLRSCCFLRDLKLI